MNPKMHDNEDNSIDDSTTMHVHFVFRALVYFCFCLASLYVLVVVRRAMVVHYRYHVTREQEENRSQDDAKAVVEELMKEARGET